MNENKLLKQIEGMESPTKHLGSQKDANQCEMLDIERIEDLRLADETYFQDICSALLRETDDVLRQIDSLLETGQLSRIAELAHRIAGLAKITGAKTLGQNFSALENATISGQSRTIIKVHSRCAVVAEMTKTALQAYNTPER